MKHITYPPNSVIGIVGGGQLGRMMAMAAARLGYRCHIYDPSDDPPAAQVSWRHSKASWHDEAALASFANSCDVITLEFENIPLGTANLLSQMKPFHPSPFALALAADRRSEKTLFNRLGIATTIWQEIKEEGEIAPLLAMQLHGKLVLKTAQFGYDGHGQALISAPQDCKTAWQKLTQGKDVITPVIAEEWIDLAAEASVILARRADGEMACYPVIRNYHHEHILAQSVVPSEIAPKFTAELMQAAQSIAQTLNYIGLLTVEFFISADGRWLANEMAPRPHNSGHWTIEGAVTSQFEQVIRAICGLPFGSTDLTGSKIVMENLLGEDAAKWLNLLADPANHLHLYGKAEARPKRKMGHVTKVIR